MELQIRLDSRGYCFAEELDDIAKPVYLVISEHVELVDDEGDWVNQKPGQEARFNLSLDEAHELIAQVQKAIAEAETKVASITKA